MRLVTYRDGADQRIGAVQDEALIDLSDLAADMLGLIAGGDALLEQARARLAGGGMLRPLREVTLLAPIPLPRKNIVCLGMNYAQHAYEGQRARGKPERLPEHPVFFTKATTTINHPDGVIPYDASISPQIDWEVELAFVIGRRGKNISEAEAMGYVFGYTIINDVSARDLQRSHLQFYKGKSLDGFAPLGPWLVTADEVPDPHALGLRLRVNGEQRQDSTTADMIFNIPRIIAVLSLGTTLEPGDIIATGTPSGVGLGMTPPVYLQPGDSIEAEIDGIGVLRNTVGPDQSDKRA
jgi:2-keto-4-pentenoate hydratase/2-oxohepta-3-ene-1,7-dioic acid hydratase in catechol pathway